MNNFLKLAFILIGFVWTAASFGQIRQHEDHNLSLIDKFIEDAKNTEVASDVILSQYIKINNTLTDEYFEYLEASLDEIRLNIQMKDITQIQKINFKQLSRKETRDIDLEGKDANHIYFLKIKDRLLLALYLEDNKIASFTLVSKGNNLAHFVTY